MAKQTAYNNVASLNKALRRLPKEAANTLRDASVAIAADVAADARGRAVRLGGVAAHVAPTLKATRDRVPVVRMAGDAMWGAEFGGRRRRTTQQFQPWRGSGRGAGYFLWASVRANSDETQERYSQALLDALRKI